MKKISLFAPVIFIMFIIFYSSSQPYKDQDITPKLQFLNNNEFITETLSDIEFTYGGNEVSVSTMGTAHFVEFFLRKAAHFGIYFLLAYFSLRACDGFFPKRKWTIVVSYLFTVLYAISDEIHQGFTGGRTPLISDVVLDSIGALFGILSFLIFHHRIRRFFYKKHQN